MRSFLSKSSFLSKNLLHSLEKKFSLSQFILLKSASKSASVSFDKELLGVGVIEELVETGVLLKELLASLIEGLIELIDELLVSLIEELLEELLVSLIDEMLGD